MEAKTEVIFQEDELQLKGVQHHWSNEDLLSQEGIFYLKDVCSVLNELPTLKVKKIYRDLEKRGECPWKVMGARKVWSHWVVRMKVFAPFYKKHLIPKTRKVEKEWDGNTLLVQKGVFRLSRVCRIIPFSTHQLRYQAKKNPKARQEFGIWKDSEMNEFLVDMEQFAPWIRSLWQKRAK